jgi:hypothetical protein
MTEGAVQRGEGLGQAWVDRESPTTGAGLGDDDVDAAVERLGELDRLPLDEQVSVYEDVQHRLARVLERDADLGES